MDSGRVPEWLKGTGCKPVGVCLRWFESSRAQFGRCYLSAEIPSPSMRTTATFTHRFLFFPDVAIDFSICIGYIPYMNAAYSSNK